MIRLTFIFLFILVKTTLFAQHQVPAARRSGFFLGAATGGSALQLSTASLSERQQTGLSFPNLKVGYMVGRRTALAVYLPGTVYRYRGEGRSRDRGFEAILPSVQYWLADRWWVLAGAGLGLDAPAFYDIDGAEERKFHFGMAGATAIGYEVWRNGRFVLDVQARAHYNDVGLPDGRQRGWAGSLLVGLNWY